MVTPVSPIVVNIASIDQAPPITSPTIIGVVAGLETAPTAGFNTPVSVRTLADAALEFGSSGYVYETCRLAFQQSQPVVVGCVFDASDAATIVANATSAINEMDKAVQHTGFKPGILIFPGYADPGVLDVYTKWVSTNRTLAKADDSTASSFVTALSNVCTKIHAIAFASAALSTVAVAGTWDDNNGAPRIFGAPQEITTADADDLPGEIFLAAALARNDATYGIFDSFSNRAVIGVTSVNPTRSFEYFGATSDAIVLRADNLTSVVRDVNGTWRVVGGLAKTSSPTDPLRYLGVRRMVDAIDARIQEIAQNRWNRQQTDNFISRLVDSVNDYLQLLVSAGALSSAVVTVDPVKNTAAAQASGFIYILVSITMPAINEQINFNVEVALA